MFDVRSYNFELWSNQLLKYLGDAVHEVHSLIDLGCSDMSFSKVLNKKISKAKIVGVDIINLEDSNLPSNFEYIKADLETPIIEKIPKADLCCFINMYYVLNTNKHIKNYFKENDFKYIYSIIPNKLALKLYEEKHPKKNNLKQEQFDKFMHDCGYKVIFTKNISNLYYLKNPLLLYLYPLSKPIIAMLNFIKPNQTNYYQAILAKKY